MSLFRFILLAVLTCAPCLAGAADADACGRPIALGAPVLKVLDLLGPETPARCAPPPGGTGTHPTVRMNAVGITAWMYCPRLGGGWSLQWAAGRWDALAGVDVRSLTRQIFESPDPLVTLNMALSNINRLLDDPVMQPVWCPFVQDMLAGIPAPQLPPPAWLVAKNGTAATRPAFALTAAGARSYTSTSAATVGAPCDCKKSLIEGVTIFCLVTPTTVAACTRAP